MTVIVWWSHGLLMNEKSDAITAKGKSSVEAAARLWLMLH
jgi:hypothetical protein